MSLVTCHPCSCAFLFESILLFYCDLSFPVFFLSFHLVHCELHTELDNLIAMQNLRYSANKGSDDDYDVSVSLTSCEPNFMAFSELNDSSGSFSYIFRSSDQDMEYVTVCSQRHTEDKPNTANQNQKACQSVSRRLLCSIEQGNLWEKEMSSSQWV